MRREPETPLFRNHPHPGCSHIDDQRPSRLKLGTAKDCVGCPSGHRRPEKELAGRHHLPLPLLCGADGQIREVRRHSAVWGDLTEGVAAQRVPLTIALALPASAVETCKWVEHSY